MNDERDGPSCCEQPDDELLRAGLTAVALELAVAGFQALWHGRSLRPDQLIPERGDDAHAAATLLAQRGRAELDADGRIVGIHGLTLRPTRHRIIRTGGTHHTWCAFDAVGIPAAVELDADAITDCPTCGRTLHVRTGVGWTEQEQFVVWLPTPRDGHLMSEFCAHANLYCSLDHLCAAIDPSRDAGRAVDIPTARGLGRDTWGDIRHLALEAESSK